MIIQCVRDETFLIKEGRCMRIRPKPSETNPYEAIWNVRDMEADRHGEKERLGSFASLHAAMQYAGVLLTKKEVV